MATAHFGSTEGLQIMLQALQQAAHSMHQSNVLFEEIKQQKRAFELRKQELEQNAKLKDDYYKTLENNVSLRADELELRKTIEDRRNFEFRFKLLGGYKGMQRDEDKTAEDETLSEIVQKDEFKGIGTFNRIGDIGTRLQQARSYRDALKRSAGRVSLDTQFMSQVMGFKPQGASSGQWEDSLQADANAWEPIISKLENASVEAERIYNIKKTDRRNTLREQMIQFGVSLLERMSEESVPTATPGAQQSAATPGAQQFADVAEQAVLNMVKSSIGEDQEDTVVTPDSQIGPFSPEKLKTVIPKAALGDTTAIAELYDALLSQGENKAEAAFSVIKYATENKDALGLSDSGLYELRSSLNDAIEEWSGVPIPH